MFIASTFIDKIKISKTWNFSSGILQYHTKNGEIINIENHIIC
jgi:hypothetical protein